MLLVAYNREELLQFLLAEHDRGALARAGAGHTVDAFAPTQGNL